MDPTFGSEGIATLEVPFHGSDLKAMAVQPDGKIVAVGFIRMGSQNADLLLCRYNTNGTLDGSFGTAGLVRHNLYNEDAFWAVALQADGKIVAAGYTSSGNSMFMCAARFNTDGSFDNSFGSNGIAVLYPKNGLSRAWAIAVLPDGKVLLGGEIGPSMFDLDQVLVRLRADGYIDMSFGGDGWVSIGNGLIESVEAIVTQENGSIVTAGKGSTLNSEPLECWPGLTRAGAWTPPLARTA
ncbi:MAG: delta-60 repeat domain-containing protein [Flavobacteriales bacterium]